MYELTHASFFSGVGGTDLGLEQAGWHTVSFSEIDPYASAVLAERWPGIPNLGDITALSISDKRVRSVGQRSSADAPGVVRPTEQSSDWRTATLWSGGFPCQDLSVAGKRAGFAPGTRSSLAFAFLDLVAAHRPPIILLENVPGLLSSRRGDDFRSLIDVFQELRYVGAYRTLDARHFGVPQRRRRVFIVGLDADRGFDSESAATVLSVGSRCDRHPATGQPKGPRITEGARVGVDIARAVTGISGKRHDDDTDTLLAATLNSGGNNGGFRTEPGEHLVSQEIDSGGVRAPDGLAGRVDDLAPTLRVGPAKPENGGPGDTVPIVYTKSRRAQTNTDDETWVGGEVMPTLNAFDVGDARTTAAIIGGGPEDDPLLPLGLDSHRYRCCGNGVVAPVAEFIGRRLAALAQAG